MELTQRKPLDKDRLEAVVNATGCTIEFGVEGGGGIVSDGVLTSWDDIRKELSEGFVDDGLQGLYQGKEEV
ncbi:hypothetical protein EH93P2_00039 [Enterococcus phage EH93P2]|nr:hypothetical protein EH93P1_00081 [Enterococcus phage EH93P1]WAX15921.1 hypothetical protein EH93P2_00039 [Enterococcus phage EH93P2]